MKQFEILGIDVGKGKFHEEAFYGVIMLYNLLNNSISAYLKNFDVSPAKFNVLMIIKHQGKEVGISQVDISKRLVVTPSNMTRLIDKLEKEKFVERFAREGDRRVNIIKITEKGSKLLDDIWPGYLLNMKKLLIHLNKGEQKMLSSLLMKWIENLIEGEAQDD